MSTETNEQKIQKLFTDGKLVHLHIGRWGMAYKLDANDLGLKSEDVPKFMRLGEKLLMPASVVKSFTHLESKARNYLSQHSKPFPISAAHFITNRVIIKVLEQLNAYRDEYRELTTKFLSEYESAKTEMLETYAEHRATLEPYYPTVDEVGSKFFYTINVFEVSLPKKMKNVELSEIKAEVAAQEEIKNKYTKQFEDIAAQSLKQINDFLVEAVADSRERIVDAFTRIAEKLRNGETITKTNINTLSKVIEHFDNFNFVGDTTVGSHIVELRELLSGNQQFSTTATREALRAAITDTLEAAADVKDAELAIGCYKRRLELD